MKITELDLGSGRKLLNTESIAKKFSILKNADTEMIFIQFLDEFGDDKGAELLDIGSAKKGEFKKIHFSRKIVISGATALVLIHNHIVGEPTPSKEDKTLTNELISTCEINGMRLFDHVIIGKQGYYSTNDDVLTKWETKK